MPPCWCRLYQAGKLVVIGVHGHLMMLGSELATRLERDNGPRRQETQRAKQNRCCRVLVQILEDRCFPDGTSPSILNTTSSFASSATPDAETARFGGLSSASRCRAATRPKSANCRASVQMACLATEDNAIVPLNVSLSPEPVHGDPSRHAARPAPRPLVVRLVEGQNPPPQPARTFGRVSHLARSPSLALVSGLWSKAPGGSRPARSFCTRRVQRMERDVMIDTSDLRTTSKRRCTSET